MREEHLANGDTTTAASVAEALLLLLKARGVDYLFANAGTDFPSIIEAYARAPTAGLDLPSPIAVPHEHAAVSMAHGHFLASGRMQAAMVHVTVGMANSLCALMNAAREQIPIFFAAGRTPLTETGHPASRDVSIHWGQEMYDQAGMLGEFAKWRYELHGPAELESVLDRAIALAYSDPGGPVYLGMPRESLAEPIDGFTPAETSRLQPSLASGVDLNAIYEVATRLAGANRPLIVTSRTGRDPVAVEALSKLAELGAIPVIEYRANYLNLPTSHPMHAGFEFDDSFAEHDVILVIDTPAPWLPARHRWPEQATVIQIAADPLVREIPIRGFPCDIPIVARPSAALPALVDALTRELESRNATHIEARRISLTKRHRMAREAVAASLLPKAPPATMTAAWATRCLDRAKGPSAVLFNELGCQRPLLSLDQPGSFFGPSNAGGLGWAFPASLGYKLAAPERRVIACVGDGSYMFANPVACHQVAAAQGIATLTVVFNNRRWEAVRTATRSVFPDGHAIRANSMPLVPLDPSPDFEGVAKACGSWAEKVTDPFALPEALERAIARVDAGEPALLNLLIDD